MILTFSRRIYLNIAISLFAILLLLAVAFIAVSTNAASTDFFYISFLTLVFVAFLAFFNIDKKVKLLLFPLFILKLFVIYFYALNNDIVIFPDSHNYLDNLNRIIASGDFTPGNIRSIAGTLDIGHYYSMLAPYAVFETPQSIVFTNALITSVAVTLLFKVFDQQFGRRIALLTTVFAFLSMNMTVFGSFILKDSLVVFLSALAIYLLKVKNRPYLALILSLLLVTVRIYAGLAFAAAILFELLFVRKTSRKAKLSALVVIILGYLLLLLTPSFSLYVDFMSRYATDIFSVGLVVSTFAAIAKFYFSPLPWNVFDDMNVYSVLLFDSVVSLLLAFALLLFALKFLSDKQLRAKTWIYILPIITHAVALGYAYAGDSARQRLGVFTFLILTYAIGLFYKKETRAE